ncbi:MAG: sialidase family protein [Microcella pacifica]|uniref:sialidase family protein n=1 Tax=Microcella pacifica TaxID=2591847 RepID=UPI0033159DDE
MAAALSITGSGVVASAPAMFSAAVRSPEAIVVAFSTVADGWPGGEVRVVRSFDGGREWTAPVTVARPREGEASVLGALGMVRLTDGTVLLPYNGVHWTLGMGTAGRRLSLNLACSRDGGETFETGDPIDVDFFWPAVYGQILELDDGELLWPIWGRQTESEKWRAVVLSSTSAGSEWRVKSTIAFDAHARLHGTYVETGDTGAEVGADTQESTHDPGFRPHDPTDGVTETTVCELADGSLLAVMRQQGVGGDQALTFIASRSLDRGETWSDYELLAFSGMSPALWRLPDGQLLLASRRHAPEESGIEPGVEVRLGTADGKHWESPITLEQPDGRRPASEYQCGYPAIVPGGTPDAVLVVFYGFDEDTGRYLAWNEVTLRP